MIRVLNSIIYYIKRLKSGHVICKIPPEGEASVIAVDVKTIQEVNKIVEEDSNNDKSSIT